jgi:hypothetical protein
MSRDFSTVVGETRWDENAGLRRDADYMPSLRGACSGRSSTGNKPDCLGVLTVDPTTLTDRDEEAAKLAGQQTPPGGLVPDLTVNYYIEQAKP